MAIVALVATTGSATYAWFDSQDTSGDNTFVAGTLTIDVQQNAEWTTPVTNWQPGEETTVRFDVKNTGSLPVYMKGYAMGSWSGTGLNADMVKVTKVEYYDAGVWHQIIANPSGLTGEYFYNTNGVEADTMWALAAGATEQFRLTVLFSSDAGNSYQGATYTAQVHMTGKQTNTVSGEGWTGSY